MMHWVTLTVGPDYSSLALVQAKRFMALFEINYVFARDLGETCN